MSKLFVDLDELDKNIKRAEELRGTMEKAKTKINAEINNLCAAWEGPDATAFKEKWDAIANNDYEEMIKSLKEYIEFIKYAENEYKKAQDVTKMLASKIKDA